MSKVLRDFVETRLDRFEFFDVEVVDQLVDLFCLSVQLVAPSFQPKKG